MSLRTDNIMHPSQDPFSRARIPYLECSPPRHVKSSIMDLVKDWENITIHRYTCCERVGVNCRPGSEERVNCNMTDMRDEFDWYLSLATQNSMYPYNTVLIPKIEAISNLLFTKDVFYTSNDRLAVKLLERKSPT